MTRANKGGQVGMNGEWYEGGCFLPRTKLTKMAKATKVSGGKVEIEPYKWVESRDGFKSIYKQFPYHPDHHQQMREQVNPSYINITKLDELYQLWTAGERWVAA